MACANPGGAHSDDTEHHGLYPECQRAAEKAHQLGNERSEQPAPAKISKRTIPSLRNQRKTRCSASSALLVFPDLYGRLLQLFYVVEILPEVMTQLQHLG